MNIIMIKKMLQKTVVYALIIIGGLAMVAPFIWMILSSFKSFEEIFVFPPTWLPEEWAWNNYVELFNKVPMLHFLLNSVKLAVLCVCGTLLSCSITAFALARLKFPGRNIFFMIVLGSMMIPWQATWIPVYIIMQKLHWIDTHYPLWVPSLFGSSFGIFLLRQFFLGIPKDLEEAGYIDGCTPFGIYWRIFLPLCKPALVALGIFAFLWSWNDLLGPLIYLNTTDKMTLTAGLSFLQSQHSSDWHLMMAGSCIATLPLIVIYFFAQEAFVKGITMSGIKG
jgi:multiple sugar transport system permease protein